LVLFKILVVADVVKLMFEANVVVALCWAVPWKLEVAVTVSWSVFASPMKKFPRNPAFAAKLEVALTVRVCGVPRPIVVFPFNVVPFETVSCELDAEFVTAKFVVVASPERTSEASVVPPATVSPPPVILMPPAAVIPERKVEVAVTVSWSVLASPMKVFPSTPALVARVVEAFTVKV